MEAVLAAIGTFFINLTTPAYEGEAAQGTNPPYAIWMPVNGGEDTGQATYKDEDEGLEVHLSVHCWGLTATQAVQVSEEVSAGFKGTPIVPTGWRPLRRPRREFFQLLPDPLTRSHQAVSRWNLRFTKTS